MGMHIIKSYSKTQSLIALSSGESELYATLKAAAEGLGIIAMLSDLGVKVTGEVWGDASAPLGIINRKGLGKLRHIDIGHLWIQEVAARGRPKFHKVLGKENPADLYTKNLDEKTNHYHTTNLAYRLRDGRADEAPQLHNISQSREGWEHGQNFEVCEWLSNVLNMIDNNWEKVARTQKQNERTMRDASQGSSTTSRESLEDGCESWLGPDRTWSYLVSH